MNQKVLFFAGLVLALAGAAMMVHGTILGEDTVSVAIFIGIIGVLLIGVSRYRLLDRIGR
jgi:uncharacterized membrane protein